jgi:hypothetical protein
MVWLPSSIEIEAEGAQPGQVAFLSNGDENIEAGETYVVVWQAAV